jgi:hypothetical protein
MIRTSRPYRAALLAALFSALLAALLSACSGEPPPAAPEPPPTAPAQPPEQPDRRHAPPAFDRLKIPADNPAWEGLHEGFVGSSGFYGERQWDDVTARVIGHQAAALRDLARLAAAGGALALAAERYTELADRLEAVKLDGGIGPPIREALVAAARRDAALCAALARGEAPPIPEDSPVAALRARYLGAAITGGDLAPVIAEAEALLEAPPWEGLDIGKFDDFDDRHKLRQRLYRHALDATDPLSLDVVWGYWTPDEATRQVRALLGAARAPGAEPLSRPAQLAAALRGEEEPVDFSAVELGWLPTGDSYVDVGGEPGPRAIGELERLGLTDPDHLAWLETRADALDAAALHDPDQVPALIAEVVEVLDGYGHGSRFYNIKQARNAGVRQLARAGHYALALEVLRTHYPLHAQDWACPNRPGIAQGLEGRLMALAGRPGAEDKLREAVATGDRWLKDIAGAKAAPGPHP